MAKYLITFVGGKTKEVEAFDVEIDQRGHGRCFNFFKAGANDHVTVFLVPVENVVGIERVGE